MLITPRSLLAVTSLFLSLAAPLVQAQALPAGITAVTSVEGIDEYRLPNGLQVLLVPDDSKPTTTVNLTYRVGSREENYGETGMAHLLEHMLFKGTPKMGDPKAELSRRGFQFNGTTSFDRTNYFASFAANDANLKWYLDWEADAMVNSTVSRRDLDSEMTVVRNEMERGENSPGNVLVKRAIALMFDWHNYAHLPIGARSDVENVDIPRLQAFYRTYYQPDNATLIVAGKFDPARTLAWIGEAFGPIPKPTRALPVLYTLDPVQDGERSVTLRRNGGSPLIEVGYHTPPAASADGAAIELLTLILGDPASGRLYKRLTQKQLVASADSFSLALFDPGAIFFGADLAPGQDLDKARTEMLATIESFAKEPVSAEELARAKGKWLKGWDQSFTNPERVGIALSTPISQGDWRLYFLTRDRVRDIALADVQRVAAQYLIADNRTLAVYLPTDKPLRSPAPARVDVAQQMQAFKPQAAGAKVEAFDATPANIDARTQTFEAGGVKGALLPKGTRGGAVQAVLTLHLGDEKSLFGQGTASEMTAALLDKGTKTLTREQVQDRLDQLRTDLRVSGSGGRLSVSLTSRRENLPAAIALVGDLLRNPALNADALGELKREQLTAIEQQRKEPAALAQNTLARLGNPYPRGDIRYASTFDEAVDDINRVTMDDVRAFHRRFYGASHAEFAAVGDMDPAAVRAAVQSAFGDWKSGVLFVRVPQPLIARKGARLLLSTPDKQNANMLTQFDIPLNDVDADYPAVTMANYLLGSGSSSRLWKRIRETEGLSYGVGSSISWSNIDRNSGWQASAIFAPQNLAKVETAFNEEVARALKDGFTAEELKQGQASLLNFRQLARSQDAGLAGALASNLYLGRTFALAAKVDAAIAALTVEQVNAALRTYLKPDGFVAAYAGDFKQP